MSVSSPRRRLRWGALILGLIFLALAVAAYFFLPAAINTTHTTTAQPIHGQVRLPLGAPART